VISGAAALLLLLEVTRPAAAGQADLCLDPAAEPRAALAGCDWAEVVVRLQGRDSKRQNPRGSAALPPAIRQSAAPLARIGQARAYHLARVESVGRPTPR
jgi:hypothetical protein